MKVNSSLTAREAQGMWIYHFAWGGKDDPAVLARYEDLGFLNVYPFFGDAEKRRRAAAAGASFWIGGMAPLDYRQENGKIVERFLKPHWKEDMERRVEAIQKEGLWDAVLGFDYDEPMLASTNELIEEITEEFAKYGKRQFAIFSAYELVDGSHPSSNDPEYGKEAHLINRQSCRFFTDIGYDLYHDCTYTVHRLLTDEMKRRVGREDVYIWFVPCTWSLFNRRDEDHALEHLETSYRLLREQSHPGGLACYNWHSFEGKGESLDWLFAPDNPHRWEQLERRMIEIGNEIINTPLKPLTQR